MFVYSSKNVPKIFQIVTLLFFVVSSIALKALLPCKSLVDQQSITNFSLALDVRNSNIAFFTHKINVVIS